MFRCNFMRLIKGITIMIKKGIAISAGIGIGKVLIIPEHDLNYTPKEITDTAAEIKRYHAAVEKFINTTTQQAENLTKSAGEKEAEIMLGHIAMLNDPYMNSEIEKLIEGGQCAEASVEQICDMFINIFSAADDELTNQRAADVRDIKTALLSVLLDIDEFSISSVPRGTVLVAKELTPSMTAGIIKENIAGIITKTGGKTSHSAILAKALEIPAVLSVGDITRDLQDGMTIIVDGTNGDIIESPDDVTIDEYTKKREKHMSERESLKDLIGKPTITADGIQIELVGNIGTPEEANAVLENDGEGVGLFRSEFLFMDRANMPTEDEQFESYKKAALVMKEKPLIIRLLDVGGDKDIPYLGLAKEENPFLGFRAVRFGLRHEDIYRSQIRAILRASAYGNVSIMVPLVTCVDEFIAVKQMVRNAMHLLDGAGLDYNNDIKIGVMIETPAACMIADLLAAESDFFSIGTNDLTGYMMAVDRGNANVSYLYSAFQPAVLRAIKHIIECAANASIPVGMCGEAASDPMLIPLLISFGLNELSISPTSILAVRKAILNWSKAEADKIADKALSLKCENDVVNYLSEATAEI